MQVVLDFCASFWPTGWYTQLIMALLLTATLINARYWSWPHMTTASVMWLSWVGARLATEYASPLVAGIVCFICALLLFPVRSSVAKLIAVLYLPRVVVLGLGHLGVYPTFVMWEINNLIVVMQIVMLAGGANDRLLAGLDRLYAGLCRYGADALDRIAAVAPFLARRSAGGRKT